MIFLPPGWRYVTGPVDSTIGRSPTRDLHILAELLICASEYCYTWDTSW